MLSILIPTYDYDVTKLVTQLHNQLIKSNIAFEIIVLDDGSISIHHTKNNTLNNLKGVTYKKQPKNVGHSENRNCLAKEASFKYLLFIDGDSLLPNIDYIDKYITNIQDNTTIIYGGRIHPKKVSSDRKLRHKYGLFHEDTTALERQKNKYKCLLFNNTLILKELFNKIKFDKIIVQYGHEDTLFAYQTSKLNTPVLHIENPVLHGDVDLNNVFYSKTKKSIENLNLIYQKNIIDPNFITFLKYFTPIKKIGLNYILSTTYFLFHPLMKLISTSKYPSLFVFNLFRLTYFCHINLKNKNA